MLLWCCRCGGGGGERLRYGGGGGNSGGEVVVLVVIMVVVTLPCLAVVLIGVVVKGRVVLSLVLWCFVSVSPGVAPP